MRLISGSAGGLRLEVPKSVTRPTQERVRGAVFNALADRVPSARVLDLFAGSGALGLEALSRGACSALMVDSERSACAVIERNLNWTKLAGGEVLCLDALRALERLQAQGLQFDLIVADPPYVHEKADRDWGRELLDHPCLQAVMAPGAVLVLEVSRRSRWVAHSAWELLRQRDYGDARLWWLGRAESAAEPAPIAAA
jgi:16S rRNA (guanine966-N2)-methyltransferase